MITTKGQVKIMDFGLAKLAGRTAITKEGMTLGTVAYMSPEQGRGEKVDHRTDIWAFGVVLYEMITGQHPFKGEYDQAVMYLIMNETPEPITGLRTGVPIELEQVVNKCLEKDAAKRYHHIDEVLVDLRLKAIQTELQPPAGAENLTLKALLRHARKPRFAIPAILIMAVLCFFAVRFYNASAKIQWARSTALPEIDNLIGKQKFGEAFSLARQAERYIPDDPLLRKLLQSCSTPVWIKTTPPGAVVYCRDYLSVDADWE